MLHATAPAGRAAQWLLLLIAAQVLFLSRCAAFPVYVTSNGSVLVETTQGQDLVLAPSFGGSVVARGLLEAQVRDVRAKSSRGSPSPFRSCSRPYCRPGYS